MTRRTRCYIAFGSNLNDPQQQVDAALRAIAALPDTELLAISSMYRSRAVGPGQQPDYINGACKIDTALTPRTLLRALQQIEAAQGRKRRERWAARPIDLDILLYGEQHIEQPALKIPHPRMLDRDFVLAPLCELAPQIRLPDGTLVKSRLDSLPDTGLERLAPKQNGDDNHAAHEVVGV